MYVHILVCFYIFDANCLAIVIFICLANTTYFAICIANANDILLYSDMANALFIRIAIHDNVQYYTSVVVVSYVGTSTLSHSLVRFYFQYSLLTLNHVNTTNNAVDNNVAIACDCYD